MQLNIGKLAPSIPRTWTRRAWWRAEPPCSSLPCVKGMSVEGRMRRPPRTQVGAPSPLSNSRFAASQDTKT